MCSLDKVAIIYNEILQEDTQILEYLYSRGLLLKTINYFTLGAAGNLKKLQKKLYENNLDGEELNIIKNNKEYFFCGATIPLVNMGNQTVNISARTLFAKAKYINLPKIPISTLFAADKIQNRYAYRPVLHSNDYAFICEGQFDTIIMHQRGLFTLGILGVNNITLDMIYQLNLFDHIILLLDNDSPGEKATKVLGGYIRHYCPDVHLYKAKLPNRYNDITDYFKNGGQVKDIIKSIEKYCPPKNQMRKKKVIQKEATRCKFIESLTNDISIYDYLKYTFPNMEFVEHENRVKLKCPLPNHNDTVGSFTIYLDSNTYYCFGCGSSRTLTDLVKGMNDYKGDEAVATILKWRSIHEGSSAI
ncbi:hypothetical protein COV24_02190 [candidate division WWE3 bacterium CG10_big_fil_rev_8_21_14_0_10_32_10]|uniref:Toprim domain-containing protein n=1 Tax=candidate division WWE3 bacterium CG10_big_fil_rev_8_21_14_0_10_32_10 TaxID=1975090 RepID=A0A2H0RCI5_UNCKA|nr:MAG: hypothetical protein COV24_02190 [candidate division WWE3 bacterium CG10_big_fil_rev_8_21_14_0_10_32_10]